MSLQPLSIIFKKKNLSHKHVFNPSSIQDLLQKESLFDLPNIEQIRTIEKNPHHWLTTDILQIHHFQYQFFQNLTLNTKTKEQIQIYSLFLRKLFRHNYQLVWHSKFQDACINFPQRFTQNELLPFLDTPDNQHPQYYNLLDFPSSHFKYLAYDSDSLDKSLNLPPPVRPYIQQHYLPPSTDTISNVSIHTLPSSSNAVVNPTPSINQHIPTSTSQVTTINENLPTSHPPNQYTTPSNTPPAVPYNTVQPSAFQIPTIPPIPLSLNNTLPTQSLPQNPPPSSTHDPSLFNQNPFSSSLPPIPSISQTTSSTTQSTSYNPILLSILLFKTSPLILSNPLQTPLILFVLLQHYLSILLLSIHPFIFQPLLLSLLLLYQILLNSLMASTILILLKNS